MRAVPKVPTQVGQAREMCQAQTLLPVSPVPPLYDVGRGPVGSGGAMVGIPSRAGP